MVAVFNYRRHYSGRVEGFRQIPAEAHGDAGALQFPDMGADILRQFRLVFDDQHAVFHAAFRAQPAVLCESLSEQPVGGADIELIARGNLRQSEGLKLQRRIVAEIDAQGVLRSAEAHHRRASGLIVPESAAVFPIGVVAVEAVLASACRVARNPVGPRLVGRRAHHELVELVGVGEVGEVLHLGERLPVVHVCVGFGGGNVPAVDVRRAGGFLDVVAAVLVLGPELALRLAHAALDGDVVHGDALTVAHGLGREPDPGFVRKGLKRAEIVVGYAFGNRLAQVEQHGVGLLPVFHDEAAHCRQPVHDWISAASFEFLREVPAPVLRSCLVAVHADSVGLQADGGERVDDSSGVAVPLDFGGSGRELVAFETDEVRPAVLGLRSGRGHVEAHYVPVAFRRVPGQPASGDLSAQVEY